jgi:hypothetical protein
MFYKHSSTTEEGHIILEKNMIDLSKYSLEIKDNGDIIAKPKTIVVDVLDTTYTFSKAKIITCLINDIKYENISFISALQKVYGIIKNGARIIINTRLNIDTKERNDKGFKYMPEFGISVQGACADLTLKEIIHQSKKNDIVVRLEIQLQDGTKVKVCS